MSCRVLIPIESIVYKYVRNRRIGKSGRPGDTESMTHDLPDTRDPIELLASDHAADCVPIDSRVTFDEWCALVDDVAADIEHTLRAEVPA